MTTVFERLVNSRTQWVPSVVHAFKKTLLVIAGGASAFAIAAMILWDADFYVVRERWESFKHAMFGDWPQIQLCEKTIPQLQKNLCQIDFKNESNQSKKP
jgi:hypothetical protein